MPPTRAQISVALDNTAGAALDALIADGTPIGDAVRDAMVFASAARPYRTERATADEPIEQWLRRFSARVPSRGHHPDVARAASAAPPTQGSRHPRDRWARLESESGLSDACARLDHMGPGNDTNVSRKRGRPARHLLSGIAVCGVCDAPVRVGAQNAGRPRGLVDPTPPPRYRVYECTGWPGQSGFHVSMHQERLDRIVTDAVLERIATPYFEVPRVLKGESAREEHEALLLEIESLRRWLDEVRKESKSRKSESMLLGQEAIVLPRIQAANKRIIELEKRDPLIFRLNCSFPVAPHVWDAMPIGQRRHVIQTMVTPRIHPVHPTDRSSRALNEGRVELVWGPPVTT